MRRHFIVFVLLLCAAVSVASVQTKTNASCCTLTLVVEGMDSAVGNLGILVFDNAKGWPDDRGVTLRDLVYPARKGTQTVKISDLPPGKYAIALIHDLNQNHKLDKNWIGKPKE
jgi:uncharacterized protein (DUF2141 family)